MWSDCHWVVNRFAVEGHPYAVMHMNHPGNPGKTVYSTRNYGRFGAFARHRLQEGEPLRLRYRLIILDAAAHQDWSVAHFEKRYREYVGRE